MLPCGHHRTCIFSYLHKGTRRKHCIACLIEKVGIPTIDDQRREIGMKEEEIAGMQKVVAERADEMEGKKVETVAERMARARAAKKS